MEKKRYQVKIPAGVRTGSRVRLPGKGAAGMRGAPAGDLYVVTTVQSSPIFKLKGNHLEVEVPLSISEAVLGATITVPTLQKPKRIRVGSGTAPGAVQRLKGIGVPRLGSATKGDIHYRFVVQIPQQLDPQEKALFEQLNQFTSGASLRAHLSDEGDKR
jgi:molecular chaperone DnaJ